MVGQGVRRLVQAGVWPTDAALRVLFSFAHFGDYDFTSHLAENTSGLIVDAFADSGAYTAWKAGSTIDLVAYAEWCIRWRDLFSAVTSLDAIGDAVASFKQTERLRVLLDGKCKALIPVFHSNDQGGFEWLRKYIDAGYDYIGISPTGPMYTNRALLRKWLAACFAMRPPHVRYHGFGVTSLTSLAEFPWYSVDSTTWTTGRQFAELRLFDERRGELVNIHTRELKELMGARALLKRYGVEPTDVRADKPNFHALDGASFASWVAIERWCSKRVGSDMRIYLGLLP